MNLSASKTRSAVKDEEKPKINHPPSPTPLPPQHEEPYEEEEEEEEEEIQSVGNLLNNFHGDGGYGDEYDEY